MSVAGAYAIERAGEIDVSSVSSTERAAKVNWLVNFCGLLVFDHIKDEAIEEVWKDLSVRYKAQCIPITIERKTP